MPYWPDRHINAIVRRLNQYERRIKQNRTPPGCEICDTSVCWGTAWPSVDECECLIHPCYHRVDHSRFYGARDVLYKRLDYNTKLKRRYFISWYFEMISTANGKLKKAKSEWRIEGGITKKQAEKFIAEGKL